VILRLAALLLLLGCTSLVPAGRTASDRCRDADDAHLAWYAVGIASSGLAGATGAGGVLTATLADEPGADIALAASSAVLGVLATVAGVLAGEYAERASEACSGGDERRVHETLRMTPAMACGVSDHVWSIEELISTARAMPPTPVAPEAPPDPYPAPLSRAAVGGMVIGYRRRPGRPILRLIRGSLG